MCNVSLSDSRRVSDREAVLKPKFARIVLISGGGWERVLPNHNQVRTKHSEQQKEECLLKLVTLLDKHKASTESSSMSFSEDGRH